jgi:hypothetical protein
MIATDRRQALFPIVLGFSFLLAPLLAGCGGGARLTNMWRDPNYSQGTMTSVYVVALRKDPIRRRMWEDAFVNELARRGVTAEPSYLAFPDAVPDTQQVVAQVREKKYDGVLASRRLPTREVKTYVPGYTTQEPVTVQSPWTMVYRTYYQEVTVPGYTEVDRVVRFETDLWTTKEGGHLVWSGTTEMMNPTSGSHVRDEITEKIVPELAKAGMVPKK